jgi:hypothetical protein
MAKKAKKISAEVALEYKPCLYIDLPSRGMLDGLELGETVELTIRGKVKGMSSSSRKYPDGAEAHHTLDIEDYSVKMSESGKFEAMADDMDEDD